jgi:hypothetical protein
MTRSILPWLVLAAFLTAGACAVQGCGGEQTNRKRSPSSSTVVAGITAPPTGPFPRGTPNPSNAPDPASVGPNLTLIAPDRGAQVTTPTVEVRVRATDPDGVASVAVAGGPASPAGAEVYSAVVALTPGMNLITVEATDLLGNLSSSYVSVVQGQFQADDQIVTQSVGVSLTQAGLDAVSTIAEQETAALNLYSLIAGANPIVSNFALKVHGQGLAHDPLQFQIDGTPSGVELAVDIDNLVLATEIEVIGLTLTRANITASRVTLRAAARVNQSTFTGTGVGKKALGLEIDQVSVDMDGFKVVTPSGAINFVLIPFQGMIKNLVEGKLKDMILDVADQELSKSLAGLDTPMTVNIPNPLNIGGQPLDMDFMFQIDAANGFAGAGLGAAGGISATASQPFTGASRQVLVSGAQIPPQVMGPEAFSVALSQDAVNALLHAVYATGGLKIALDGTQPSPTVTIPLAVKMLYPFLPQVRDVAPDPNTPIVIEVELCAAPVVELGAPQPNPLGASVGEAQIKVLIDYMDGSPRAELFTLRAAVSVGGDVQLSATEVKISALDFTDLRVDITDEPLVDLADQEIEDFIECSSRAPGWR